MQCFHTFAHFLKMLPQPFHMSGRSIYACHFCLHTHIRDHTTSQGSCRDWGTVERHKETNHDLEITGQGPEHLLHTQNTSINLQSAYSYGPCTPVLDLQIHLSPGFQAAPANFVCNSVATATSSSSTAKLIPYFQ